MLDKYDRSQRPSVGSVTIVILLLVTSLLSISTRSSLGLITIPIVAADNMATNSIALTTTTVPLENANNSGTESSISTSNERTQNIAVSSSTSPLDNSTINMLASTSNSSTTSNSTVVSGTIPTQITTTKSITSANSSTPEAVISNMTTAVATSSTTVNLTTLTNSATSIVFTSTNAITANMTVPETTSATHAQSSFRVDRWDWSTWNAMSGLALWITNTGVEPLDIFSLSVTIGGSPAGPVLYPGPFQPCPLNPVSPNSQCLFMPTPSFSPAEGNSYTVLITSTDGTQTSIIATYGGRSDDPQQFTIDAVSWTPTCCNYDLNIKITNTGGVALDTNQIATLVTLNDESPISFSACGSITPGTTCNLAFHVGTLASYVVVVIDQRNRDQVYVITPG